MCGITGVFGFDGKNIIDQMLKVIKHRGPDDSGSFNTKWCTLGINRLSILDIRQGKQPMYSENKNYILVFNGEIFNYIELKKKLIDQGTNFRTNNSDTEVILKLFEKYKLNCFKMLNGMFAIAVYDKTKNILYLARDRCGIKPLFYYAKSSKFIFSSEIKSILKSNIVEKSPNFNALNYYFSLKNIPSPHTSYKNIYQVKPGEILIVNKNEIKKKIFWDIKYAKNNNLNIQFNSKKIFDTLDQSVKIRMRSDVEVGAFLSGGLDSSAICKLASKYTSKKLKTFTLIYEKEYKNKAEDRFFARKISQEIKSDHHELFISPKNILKNIEPALEAFDQPFAGVISGYFLSKLISKHVKTCLSGDGADELFGSYKFPRNISKIKGRINNDEILRIKDDCFTFNSELRKTFLSTKINKKYYKHTKFYYKDILKKISCSDILNKSLILEFKTLLADQVLSFVDIHSMQHSLEIRPPFLDNNLVELSFQIPGSQKIQNDIVKLILKKSLTKILPNDLITRKKEGFVMPIEQLFIKKNKKMIISFLNDKNLNKHNFLNNNLVKHLSKNIDQNSFEKNNILWIIYCYQLWWNKNF